MGSVQSVPLPGTQEDPRYPDSDGRLMGETQFHNLAMRWLTEALEDHFAGAPDVFVASNLMMYDTKGDPKSRRDPDALVAKGVGKHCRRAFRVWEEGVVPCTLFEVASRTTWRIDLNVKPAEYAGLGVKEYFLFDPEGRYLDPALQGFRTVKGQPVPMRPAVDGSLVSKQLGLRLVPQGEMLRLIDLATGKPIPTRTERAEQQLRELEQQRADQEQQRADQERHLREQEQQRADQERQRAEQAEQRAAQARQRVEELEAELRRLRHHGGNNG